MPHQIQKLNTEIPAEDLLARVARGDLEALGELYDHYAPRLYGLMTQILPSREAAEEILREVFLRLWNESSHLSRSGGSVAAWLVVSTRGAAVERLRALRVNPSAEDPSTQGEPAKSGGRMPKPEASPASAHPGRKKDSPRPHSGETGRGTGLPSLPAAWLPQPKGIALIDGRMALLHKAINQLPKPQRDALDLAVFAGMSESEIAAALGEPLGKVRSSLRAAVTFVKHRRRAVCGTWAANI